ncbi:hypothetical protein EJ03DRAFT_375273 [Teratosphaeria nubilosa]|uniref:Concanavalin A-like lectin/glucanase n=1 Tax=Teratosphaeria nubilosa TaxID=161662 RepID=A0A6G1L6U8_9PEZI|nr:hypothetical protein EJ03DRAFT_375273 [Teratosphaeria nubilosa]
MFYLGPIPNHNHITHATYSLHLPATPSDYRKNKNVWLALWIGLQNDPAGNDIMNEDFVQPLLNWAVDQEGSGCPAHLTNWCAAASTYTPAVQVQQPYISIPSDKRLDFEISITLQNAIHQSISIDGKIISQQTSSQGMHPSVIYSGTECYDHGCGTVPAHRWSNISLTLNAPTTGLDQALTLTGAKCSGLQTSDGGKTWEIASMEIEAQNLNR